MRIQTIKDGEVTVSPKEKTIYPAGRVFNVDRETAEALAKQGAIRRLPKSKKADDSDKVQKPTGEDLTTAIVLAINGLDPENEEHWTRAGKPGANALESTLGYPVSAAERDAAWAAVEAAAKQPSLPNTGNTENTAGD